MQIGAPDGEILKMDSEVGSLSDFAHMAAITYVDTVFSHETVHGHAALS
jgi:hypothetical protein